MLGEHYSMRLKDFLLVYEILNSFKSNYDDQNHKMFIKSSDEDGKKRTYLGKSQR